jgi:GMP synthase-like glutamine amidotransferase
VSGRARVVIVQNSPGSGPGRLPGWLVDEQIDAVIVAGDDLPGRLADVGDQADGLVLLGGGFMPDDDERAPFLPRERAIVGEAVEAGVPVLGICLGAQLLALVGGGEVTAQSGETEKGFCRVDLLAAAADDELFAGLAELAGSGGDAGDDPDGGLRMMQNHKDSITRLPADAVHLGTSAACDVEAFRLGRSAWGVQFHPEAPAERIAEWDVAQLMTDGFDRSQLLADAMAHAEANTRQARALVGAFAAVVRERRR